MYAGFGDVFLGRIKLKLPVLGPFRTFGKGTLGNNLLFVRGDEFDITGINELTCHLVVDETINTDNK